MVDPALAPSHLQHQARYERDATVTDDPFASPALSDHANSPTYPQQCAYPPQQARRMPPSAPGREANKTSHGKRPSEGIPHKSASMSSAGDSTVITPMSSMDLEKVRLEQEQEQEQEQLEQPKRQSRASSKRDSRRSQRRSRDPEKAMHSGQNSPSRAAHNTNLTYEDDEDDEELSEGSRKQEEKAVKILLWMAGPCVALSAVNTIWAFIALLITTFTQPIRLCARRPTFGQQLAGLLGPTLNLQLRCIYTPLSPHANEDGSYHSVMLFVVHILSPFFSMAVMFASWVLAVYWLCSGVVGDPAGQDKRDDGKETVLGLRNWWEKWLMKGVQEV